jgi:hypothetical protein
MHSGILIGVGSNVVPNAGRAQDIPSLAMTVPSGSVPLTPNLGPFRDRSRKPLTTMSSNCLHDSFDLQGDETTRRGSCPVCVFRKQAELVHQAKLLDADARRGE